MPCKRTVVGKTYSSKRWAERWAAGRPVKKVAGGYKIMPGRKSR